MTTSGTYDYNPEVVEWIDEAFESCGIDPATLKVRHLRSARRSLNLLFAHWESLGDQEWRIEAHEEPLVVGQAEYEAPAGTFEILPGHVIVQRAGSDTPVHIISRENYHQIPNKENPGLPTNLFFNRPTFTYYLWPVPDQADTLRFWRLCRLQDVTAGSETVDVEKHWFNALAKGLAWQLAYKYAPDRITALKGAHDEAYRLARQADRGRGDVRFEV